MTRATKDNHYLYNKRLRPFASDLRKRMTKAEACLWKYVLKAGMMKNYTFNRQRPVKSFIADFMCKPLRLVIEVDGMSHQEPGAHLKDRIKDRELKGAGFKVVRFTDDEVLKDIEGVKRAIESWVEERETELGATSRPPRHLPLTPDQNYDLPLIEGDERGR